MGKLLGNRMILIGGAAAVVVLIVVGVMMSGVIGGGGGKTPEGEVASAEAGGHEGETAAHELPAVETGEGGAKVYGQMYYIRDRVVNLADPGGRRYLRFTIALEFHPDVIHIEEASGGGHGGGAADPQEEINKQVAPKAPVIEDTVINVLSAKFYADISTAEGKERTKHEILETINKSIGRNEIIGVYFTDFVIQ